MYPTDISGSSGKVITEIIFCMSDDKSHKICNIARWIPTKRLALDLYFCSVDGEHKVKINKKYQTNEYVELSVKVTVWISFHVDHLFIFGNFHWP